MGIRSALAAAITITIALPFSKVGDWEVARGAGGAEEGGKATKVGRAPVIGDITGFE